MNLVTDPLWPWSSLWSFLTTASPTVVLAALAVGLLAFALPLIYHRAVKKAAELATVEAGGGGPPRLSRPSREELLRAAGVILVVLLGWMVLSSWGRSGGLLERLLDSGLIALLAVPLGLIGLTVWSYLGVPGASQGRITAILVLRLMAFLLTLLAILRPSLAFSDKNQNQVLLWIACDDSKSMTIRDESNRQSRWELLLHTLRQCEPALERLRDSHVDVVLYRFAGDVRPLQLDDPGEADGKRTDIGFMLRHLYEGRDGQRPLRGLLVLSDGADNGTGSNPPLAEASRLRNLPCPVHTFACGNPTTSDRQRDIALTSITTEPSPVPVKGKLTVKVNIDAPGFENSTVRVRLFLDDKEVKAKDEALPLTTGNQVKLECTAPPTPGEVKVTVRIDAPPDDQFPGNNEIATFATVSREGISVLLVDKQRAWEPQLICDALHSDPRIRVTTVWLRGDQPIERGGDLFQFAERQYDVILLGDVTARQVLAVNPEALTQIQRLVDQGAGLAMIGGYASFGNSDWQGTVLERMLPVDLGVRGQDETPVQMLPTEAGLRRYGYLLRLSEDNDPKAVWQQLPKLEGLTRITPTKKGLESVLAESASGEPILVTQDYGKGRVLAFAGDTTHRWVRNPQGQRLHARFWRQMIVWLARQENAEGSVWVKPEIRRLPARNDLAFRVGVRSKGGIDLKDGTYKVEVIGPDDVRTPVSITHAVSDDIGVFTKTTAAGEYRIVVEGQAKDPSGEVVTGTAAARFLVYEDDLEMVRRAADHDFLKKLANAGGGQFHRVEDLPAFLDKLQHDPLAHARLKMDLWPNWRGTQRSPFFLLFFGAFVAILAGEWILRRRWGLV
jgi:uncharacterized membrane protein